MSETVSLQRSGAIALVTVDNPPVNALSAPVRQGLDAAFRAIERDAAVDAVVLLCAGRTFVAGADISEFGKPLIEPDLHSVFARLEACPKPVVVAIHGTALGGGFELALAAHYRVAAASAKVGLPEVNLGILPGCGGTQRVPRLIGAKAALDLLTTGRPIGAGKARDMGLIDAVVSEERLREEALAFAEAVVKAGSARPLARDRSDWQEKDRAEPALFDDFRQANSARWRGFRAQEAIVTAIEASLALPFDEGMKREAQLCGELLASPESAAQRAYFFAERETAKVPGLPAAPSRPLASVGVIGAGTMGTGIALALLDGGLSVTVVETGQAQLDRGRGLIEKTLESSVKRRRLSAEQAEARRGATTYALDFAALAGLDLVIEAVFEDMAVKKDVFARLDAVARPGAILASNTSFLDIDEIAAATGRPQDVIGLHFFSPANIMRLLEIVRGRETAPDVIATAFALARKLGKVGVLSGVCDGFIANRMMLPRALQAEAMALEGTPIAAIDKALVDFGFAMGHFQMMDLAGLDVVTRGQTERSVMGDLVAAGRLGQKSGAGFYDYDADRRPVLNPLVAETIAAVAACQGVAQVSTTDPAAILDRLLLPVVNESARILGEGIALRASDIDVAAILGYNWPVYRGGPMHRAEAQGLDHVVARLRALEKSHGAAFAPSDYLVERAAAGGF